jgi:hypothetical protein
MPASATSAGAYPAADGTYADLPSAISAVESVVNQTSQVGRRGLLCIEDACVVVLMLNVGATLTAIVKITISFAGCRLGAASPGAGTGAAGIAAG